VEVVEYVGDGRQEASLDAFWEGLTAEQLAGIEAVAMDMWEPYSNSTLAHVPGAQDKIVYDPYHLVRHMNDAVNTVRKQSDF
jgi:transposase